MRSTTTIALILILATSSLVMYQTVSAEIPKPSTPAFSAKIVDRSYHVEATYTTDPYTGNRVLSREGYTVENKTIDVTISNQAYSRPQNGTIYNLYYNIRIKGHYGGEWSECYPLKRGGSAGPGLGAPMDDTLYLSSGTPIQASAICTVVSVLAANYPVNATIDIQVQALIGHDTEKWVSDTLYTGGYITTVAYDAQSDWSNIQTVTMNGDEVTVSQSPATPSPAPIQPTPTASPTAEPTIDHIEIPSQPNTQADTVPQIDWEQIVLAFAGITIAVLTVAVMILWRRIPKRVE